MSNLIPIGGRVKFEHDGFIIADNLIDPRKLPALHAAYDELFNGQFETGVVPDEVNWQQATGDPSLTRQICNGWKANRTIARAVLDEELAFAIATLMGWTGVRIMIDNILWKPPAARSLAFHQDNAFISWFNPSELCTCWIALDDTTAEGGTVEFARGSHHWNLNRPEGEFHAPEDYRKPLIQAAAQQNIRPDIVPVVVPAAGGSFHHGRLWHGSGKNSSEKPRRALVLHAMQSEVQYVPGEFSSGTGPVYSRYKRLGDNTLDENYFPVLWREDGYRTPGIGDYLQS